MESTEPYLPQDKVFTADKRQYGKLGLKARARVMRHEATPAEEKLWQCLRSENLGVKFRRQHPIDRYIVDFACLSHKLIVELDGAGHLEPDQADHDQGRTALLVELGFRVVRFSNDQALTKTAFILADIEAALQAS